MLRPRWMWMTTAVALLTAPLVVGCSDKPHGYGRERPPIDELDGRDKGLQSKDVANASDAMAQSLLADPRLNGSKTQWVMVVDRVEMNAVDARGDLDVFLRRLKVNLDRMGKGRVTFVENRDKLYQLQARELDRERDDFGQGSGPRPPAGRLQPDYGLYCRVTDLPNRGTNYYFFEFTVTDLVSGVQPWTDAYEVRVAR
jgi:hypothetical protein